MTETEIHLLKREGKACAICMRPPSDLVLENNIIYQNGIRFCDEHTYVYTVPIIVQCESLIDHSVEDYDDYWKGM